MLSQLFTFARGIGIRHYNTVCNRGRSLRAGGVYRLENISHSHQQRSNKQLFNLAKVVQLYHKFINVYFNTVLNKQSRVKLNCMI